MNKLKELCFNSLTIAVSYTAGAISLFLDMVAASPDVFGVQFQQVFTDIFGNDPAHLARAMLIVSVVVFAARMRSLGRANGSNQ